MVNVDLWPQRIGVDAAAAQIASALRTDIRENGSANLIWSGGASPRLILASLANHSVDWALVTIILSDERWVSLRDGESNEGELKRMLHDTPLATSTLSGLYQDHGSLVDATQRQNEALRRILAQTASVALLGIGTDGHIASLFPERSWTEVSSEQYVVEDAIGTAGLKRISLTPAALKQAKKWLVIVNSDLKQNIWNACAEGAQSAALPASIAFDVDTPPVSVVDTRLP